MRPDWQRTLRDGLIAGAIGYLTVALFLGLANSVAGRSPFFTATRLGELLFYGGRAPAAAAGPAIAYNGVHLVAFLLIGVLAARIVLGTERHPQAYYVALFGAIAFVLLGTAVAVASSTLFPTGFATWVFPVVNVIALVAMGAFLWTTHPLLRHVGGDEAA